MTKRIHATAALALTGFLMMGASATAAIADPATQETVKSARHEPIGPFASIAVAEGVAEAMAKTQGGNWAVYGKPDKTAKPKKNGKQPWVFWVVQGN